MRREYADHQGEERKTWLSAVRIGDVAIVGVPAELFTQLGLDIKRRSPFRHTVIAELANDYVGYVGNADAYRLGGYQLWMGQHSWTERGTGEQFVDAAVEMLQELHAR
jgi:neutral ceramidase